MKERKSILCLFFSRQLGELDVMTERLKSRLHSGSEMSSSTATTARCSSVPPPATFLSIHTNSHRPDIDSSRSASTTIQTELLEHFPESLSGRPLMSNGLNVTDVLSIHNDQVRLAQELMTKANNLLESSKDFFNKPPTPTPLPAPTLTIIAEQPTTRSPPPAMPNFNATTEFRTVEKSPQANDHHAKYVFFFSEFVKE